MSASYRDPAGGSTGDLIGKVFPLVFWVSSRGTAWSHADKSAARRNLKEAHDWLQRQAKKWGKSLEFLPGQQFGRDHDIQLPRSPSGHSSGDDDIEWMRELTMACCRRTPGQLYDSILDRYANARVHATVMVNQEGRSYALGDPSDPCADTVLRTSINYRCPVRRNITWQTIAHETLHLYGAHDLYPTDVISEEQAHHARRLFPRDIMGTSRDEDTARVSALTAWRVGWTEDQEAWFDFFEPRPPDPTREDWCTPPDPPPSTLRILFERWRRRLAR